MEDIMQIKTSWARNLIAKIAMKAMKAAGYDIKLQIDDLEVHGSDSKEYLTAKVEATVMVEKSDINKWLKG